MTKEQIIALIDAKIAGQGTAIDASSVLPAILNGIMDLIDEGGGGGTSDAVQYIPQELTEAQQMQARKNLDLYNTMTEVVTDDFAGEVYRIEVDPATGKPFYGWAGEYAIPGGTNGFASAAIHIPSGYRTTSKNGFTINGREPVVSSGENWQMMVDPNDNFAILVETTAENVTVNTRFGSIVFEYPGLYASASLEIYNESGYYGCTMNSLVNSFSENRTITTDVVSQVPYKYIPTQSVGSSADNQHFPTAKNVYDYVRNNSGSGSVRYDIGQNLSSANQMQARRNQGLYYKQTANVATDNPFRKWDGNPASSYYPAVLGDVIEYCLITEGFPGNTIVSITLSNGQVLAVGTDIERRTIHNNSGSTAWFLIGEPSAPALVLEMYASEEEPVTYNGMTFIYDGIYYLKSDDYFVESLNVNAKASIVYNPVPTESMEHLKLEFIRRDGNGVSCSHTFSQAYHLLKTGCPILASYTAYDFGTSYSTEVYYDPENGINALFLIDYKASSVRYISMNLKEDDTVTVFRITFSATTQIEGGGNA